MPPPAILDPASLDFGQVIADRGAIESVLPQRDEFALLDAIVYEDAAGLIYAGFHDLREDDWWTRGHIPGRPLFPGVLMIEAAAQLASYIYQRLQSDPSVPLDQRRFIGFAAADEVKFRGAITPPARFIVVGHATTVKTRRFVCDTQGFIDGQMVFQAKITGMPV
jgi:3-hydroxyacyl-[acyl-carrier-protein] dehydratase